jgi:hypothetical protein
LNKKKSEKQETKETAQKKSRTREKKGQLIALGINIFHSLSE